MQFSGGALVHLLCTQSRWWSFILNVEIHKVFNSLWSHTLLYHIIFLYTWKHVNFCFTLLSSGLGTSGPRVRNWVRLHCRLYNCIDEQRRSTFLQLPVIISTLVPLSMFVVVYHAQLYLQRLNNQDKDEHWNPIAITVMFWFRFYNWNVCISK